MPGFVIAGIILYFRGMDLNRRVNVIWDMTFYKVDRS